MSQGPTTKESIVHEVAIHLCEPCLNGEGGECHTPGCALCWHAVDSQRIHPMLYEIIERDAEGNFVRFSSPEDSVSIQEPVNEVSKAR